MKEARYGRGSGPIAMDDVNCNGRESSLFDCRFNGWYNMDCIHEEDAGVSCLPAPTTTFSPTTTSSHIGTFFFFFFHFKEKDKLKSKTFKLSWKCYNQTLSDYSRLPLAKLEENLTNKKNKQRM